MKAKSGRERVGSNDERPISFRVSAKQRAELRAAGKRRRPSVSADVEAKLRLFPRLEDVKAAAGAGYSWELGPEVTE